MELKSCETVLLPYDISFIFNLILIIDYETAEHQKPDCLTELLQRGRKSSIIRWL